MQNAGEAAAAVILRRFAGVLRHGVEIHTGSGNNGGDGWVVAGALARLGIPVRIVEAAEAKTDDATNAKNSALRESFAEFAHAPGIVIDALLGTGSRGLPAGRVAHSVQAINSTGPDGPVVISIDLPTGLDATTGACDSAVRAHLTLALGSVKRGHLIARGTCGAIEVLDIGLGEYGVPSGTDVRLADSRWVSSHIPPIAPDAHKGTRKRLAIIGGGRGMAGAAIIAAKAALRSGIGLVHVYVAEENRQAVHASVPAAIAGSHEELLRDISEALKPADAIVIGPGLGVDLASRLLDMLPPGETPLLLDADALNACAGDSGSIMRLTKGRHVILTPHPAEMGRIVNKPAQTVLDFRFEIGADLALQTGATVLVKGTPTIVSSPRGDRMAVATGTPALATGGSGDMLSGIIGTLLAQTDNPFESAVCGAWVHGRAAELCGAPRGVTLDDIMFALPGAWRSRAPAARPPVIASLPAIA